MANKQVIGFLSRNGMRPQEIADKLKIKVWAVYKALKTLGMEGYRKDARNAVYATEEYKEFRRKVLERDKNCCTICGTKGTKTNRLQLDHILAKATHPELIFEMSNIRILCQGCHAKQPTTKAYKRLNR